MGEISRKESLKCCVGLLSVCMQAKLYRVLYIAGHP